MLNFQTIFEKYSFSAEKCRQSVGNPKQIDILQKKTFFSPKKPLAGRVLLRNAMEFDSRESSIRDWPRAFCWSEG